MLDGLLQRLVYKGLYEFAYVEIYDSDWGHVGTGFVSPNMPPSDETTSILALLRIEGKR